MLPSYLGLRQNLVTMFQAAGIDFSFCYTDQCCETGPINGGNPYLKYGLPTGSRLVAWYTYCGRHLEIDHPRNQVMRVSGLDLSSASLPFKVSFPVGDTVTPYFDYVFKV